MMKRFRPVLPFLVIAFSLAAGLAITAPAAAQGTVRYCVSDYIRDGVAYDGCTGRRKADQSMVAREREREREAAAAEARRNQLTADVRNKAQQLAQAAEERRQQQAAEAAAQRQARDAELSAFAAAQEARMKAELARRHADSKELEDALAAVPPCPGNARPDERLNCGHDLRQRVTQEIRAQQARRRGESVNGTPGKASRQ